MRGRGTEEEYLGIANSGAMRAIRSDIAVKKECDVLSIEKSEPKRFQTDCGRLFDLV